MCSEHSQDSSAQVVPVPNLRNLKEIHQVHGTIPTACLMEIKGLMFEGD